MLFPDRLLFCSLPCLRSRPARRLIIHLVVTRALLHLLLFVFLLHWRFQVTVVLRLTTVLIVVIAVFLTLLLLLLQLWLRLPPLIFLVLLLTKLIFLFRLALQHVLSESIIIFRALLFIIWETISYSAHIKALTRAAILFLSIFLRLLLLLLLLLAQFMSSLRDRPFKVWGSIWDAKSFEHGTFPIVGPTLLLMLIILTNLKGLNVF